MYPNGATDRFDPVLDSSGRPTGKFTSSSDIAAVVTGVASSTTGDWQKITVRWKDDSLWVFEPQAVTLGGKAPANAFTRLAGDPEAKDGKLYLLTQLQDLRIDWDERRRVRAVRVDGTLPSDPLLTLDYSPTTGLLAHLTDAGRRRIDYGFKPRPTAAKKAPGTTPSTGSKQPVLAFLSQLYLIGSKPTGLNHVGYDYVAGPESGAPLLLTVRVPHPGMPPGSLAVVSASIRYEKERVASHEDANGVVHRFTYKPTGTQMDIQDGTGNTLTSLAFTIDTLGRLRAIKDVQGGTKSFGYGDTDAENAAVRAGALSVTSVKPVPTAPVAAPIPPVTPMLPAAPARPIVLGSYTLTLIAQLDTPDYSWAARLGAKPSPADAPAPDPRSLVSIDTYCLNNSGLVAILGTTTRGANNMDGGGLVRVILTSDGKRENRLVTVGIGGPGSPSVGGITDLETDSAFGFADDGSVVFGANHEKIRLGLFRVTPSRVITPVVGQYSVAPIKVMEFHDVRVIGGGDICFEGLLMTGDYDKSPEGQPVPDAPPWTPPPGMRIDGVFVIHQGKLRSVSDEVRAIVPFGYDTTGYYCMNERGDAAILCRTSMVDTERIYLTSASGVRLVAKSDKTMTDVFPVAISSDGAVTFRAKLLGDTRGINGGGSNARESISGTALFEWRDGQTRKLMDEDPRGIRQGSLLVGPQGERLFFGIRSILEKGSRQEHLELLTGSDPVKDLLLGPGVSLLGAKIRDLLSMSQINKKGQFVFMASLDNKKAVLVRADPAGMAPEPMVETQGATPPGAKKAIPPPAAPTTPTVGKRKK